MINNQTISICIITKNESTILKQCLEKLLPYADAGNHEIVVVDTGSTDDTIEMCKQYTDKIYKFQWIQDFSSARNFAAKKASNDWILCIDSDEFVSEWDESQLQKTIFEFPQSIIGIYQCNHCGYGNNQYLSIGKAYRLYNRTFFHFERAVHEQLTPNHTYIKRNYLLVDIYVEHHAYEGAPDQLRQKSLRNISILKDELQNNPHDPYTLFQLGQSYYMMEDYAAAQHYYSLGLEEDVDPRLDYVHTMVVSYGYTLINQKLFEKALELEGIYDVFGTRADFVFLMGMIYMNNGYLQDAIQEFKKATTFSKCEVVGANSFRAYYNMGVIYECSGYKEEAKSCYLKCGDFFLAKQRLELL